jgi:ribosomal subunit interface protein
MKVHYTGKLEQLNPASQKKLDVRFTKLGKLIDRKSEKEAHVILTQERHQRRAEITLNYYDHPLVGIHESADFLSALTSACDKIEKQILKLQAKRRDGMRRIPAPKTVAAPVSQPDGLPATAKAPRVYRTNSRPPRKPMTVEEALLEIGDRRSHLVYRDAQTDGVCVLVRRPDGNFDLIES